MVDNFINGLSGYIQGSFLLAYLAVYLGGVLVSFTPCAYPVVPITVAFIGNICILMGLSMMSLAAYGCPPLFLLTIKNMTSYSVSSIFYG